jgi:hypothetical protein
VIVVVIVVIVIAATTHTLLTVSHDVPVRQDLPLLRRGSFQRRIVHRVRFVNQEFLPSHPEVRCAFFSVPAWRNRKLSDARAEARLNIRPYAPDIAMATATPMPRLSPAALPTSRYARLSCFKKRCAQPVKHPNPYLAISFAVFAKPVP